MSPKCLTCTPFAGQYDILKSKWGAFFPIFQGASSLCCFPGKASLGFSTSIFLAMDVKIPIFLWTFERNYDYNKKYIVAFPTMYKSMKGLKITLDVFCLAQIKAACFLGEL